MFSLQRIAALALCMPALCMAACGGTKPRPVGPLLELRDTASGKLYGAWQLAENSFAVEFIHSVHQNPVREIFGVEGKTIRPQAVRFYNFGAGMQSDLEEGQSLSRDGDALIISGYNGSFERLNYIVGTVSDHLLYINNSIISLRELCGRNAHVTIQVK